jgi:hypothetical protein
MCICLDYEGRKEVHWSRISNELHPLRVCVIIHHDKHVELRPIGGSSEDGLATRALAVLRPITKKSSPDGRESASSDSKRHQALERHTIWIAEFVP